MPPGVIRTHGQREHNGTLTAAPTPASGSEKDRVKVLALLQ